MTDNFTLKVDKCPRCEGEHLAMRYFVLANPIRLAQTIYTHWAMCTRKMEPILTGVRSNLALITEQPSIESISNGCPRCGGVHPLRFKEFSTRVMKVDGIAFPYWAMCEEKFEPILLTLKQYREKR